jgi:hypothetical protein
MTGYIRDFLVRTSTSTRKAISFEMGGHSIESSREYYSGAAETILFLAETEEEADR